MLKASAEMNKKIDQVSEISVFPIPELTTAVFGKHYSYPEIFYEDCSEAIKFDFAKSREVSAKIILFPENITEELQLTYMHAYYPVPEKMHVDTVAITLIPQF